MAEEKTTKTKVERLRGMISQLKEMEHYSRSNIEKLGEFWLALEEEIKHKDFAGRMSELMAAQSAFEDLVKAIIEDYDMECNRIQNEEIGKKGTEEA
ncbi:MAG: hypothetical protein FJY54_17560 [Betaproteobacteria bacterium]|nr:hypothetical protein [Betaproteobacteria bacterium]